MGAPRLMGGGAAILSFPFISGAFWKVSVHLHWEGRGGPSWVQGRESHANPSFSSLDTKQKQLDTTRFLHFREPFSIGSHGPTRVYTYVHTHVHTHTQAHVLLLRASEEAWNH